MTMTIASKVARPFLLILVGIFVSSLEARGQVDERYYQDMEWRNIGPYRGGRAVAIAGVVSDPLTYYFGSAAGGVYKTTDGGRNWANVSDGYFNTASVGAIAVSTIDENVVYVGMGEHSIRGVTTSHGDGVYKSTDAGKSWHHLGLEKTRSISRIRIHPRDPDIVYVAAQGAPFGPTPERGIYRSMDGGVNWKLVLDVDDTTGASDLAMDPTNPRVLYAAFWDHVRKPWEIRSGGPGSGLYKSVDSGETWDALVNGLPDVMGKVGVDVSRTRPERVYAMIEANPFEDAGLYRSDDGGASWKLMNSEGALLSRSWYYTEVYADPQNENIVYVLNRVLLKSIDGGKTFEALTTLPHGDHHDLWIHPDDHDIIANANDGGGTISRDGGASWSTQRNQATAQFYRVNTDNRFPYYVYGGQQDNSTVAIRSRTVDRGIDWKDWYSVGGCESAFTGFDPDDLVFVYAGCFLGRITEYDHRTETARDIMALPAMLGTVNPRDMTYRFNWNAPIVVSVHDARVVYHAGNQLLRTEDRGASWVEVSPDLTRDDEEKQGRGSRPFSHEGAGGEVYNTISYVAESPHDRETLWAGADDGLVHVTRDGGQSWSDVTPSGLDEALVNAIEVSPHEPAKAYIAVTRYKFNDFTPHIYRTKDYGVTWVRLVDGIDDDAFVRVVREDPRREGLLYAGTETGMYVSADDGEHWQSLQLNLPVTPITDLKVQSDDLVAATQGRSFWILDDLSPLQQIDDAVVSGSLHLYQPRRAYRLGGSSTEAPRLGRNPPSGAILDYHTSGTSDDALVIEILDARGELVRRLPQTADEPGMHRVVWDLRHEPIPGVRGLSLNGRSRPGVGFVGRRAIPGTYEVRLSRGAATLTRSLTLEADPRLDPAGVDFAASEAMLIELRAQLTAMTETVNRIQNARDQLEMVTERAGEGEAWASVQTRARALAEELEKVDGELVQRKWRTGYGRVDFPPGLIALTSDIRSRVDGSDRAPTTGARSQLDRRLEQWREIRANADRLLGEELAAVNAEAAKAMAIPRTES